MAKLHNWIFLFMISYCSIHSVSAQFADNFDGSSQPGDSKPEGWNSNTGDGDAVIDFIQKDGYATIQVDATNDKRNIWWALIARQIPELDLKKLVKSNFELRAEVRIKVSHAPRRVNLHFNHQRTTDFHSHLMEYDIPDTVNWHTISFTTHDFDARVGDRINAQMALMDWGLEKYHIEIDYFKVDVVNRDKIGKDLGTQLPYHPMVADPETFTHHIKVSHDAMIDMEYPDMNFASWQIHDDVETPLLSVSGTQIVLLKWDFSDFLDKKVVKSGLLELSTHSLQRASEYQKDFGMVRVVEILNGNANWDQEKVTFESFCEGKPLERVVNKW